MYTETNMESKSAYSYHTLPHILEDETNGQGKFYYRTVAFGFI